MAYKYYNANPLKNKVADCTIRALSLAEGESWDYTYDKMSSLAQRKGVMMDNVEFIEDYLDNRYNRMPHYSQTIDEFTKEYPKGIYLCTMPGHITCVIDGCIYDEFDCGKRKIFGAWEIAS